MTRFLSGSLSTVDDWAEMERTDGDEEEAVAVAVPRRRREKVCFLEPALSLKTARLILRGGSGSASGQLPGARACAEAAASASRSDCESARKSSTGSISVAIGGSAWRGRADSGGVRRPRGAGGRGDRSENVSPGEEDL